MVNLNGNGKDWFSRSMANGLIATIAWVLVLAIYCTFKAIHIDDPLLGQAFLLLTGAWVGSLTLAQGRKVSKNEEQVESNRVALEQQKESADNVEKRVERLTEVAKQEHPQIAEDL